MIIKITEYTIKQKELDAVLSAIQKFLQVIRAREPETSYEAYRRGSSFEFVHLMKFKDSSAEQRHQQAVYTANFVSALYPRCEIEPRFTDLTHIAPNNVYDLKHNN